MAEKAKVKVVFTASEPGRPTWPYINYDFQKRAKEITEVLKEKLSEIEFSPSIVHSGEEAEDVIREKGEYDGYLVCMTGGMWTGVAEKVMERGKPVVLADDLYAGSGGFLKAYSKAKRRTLPVVGIASSNFQDVVDTVRFFSVIRRMKESRILVVANREGWGSGNERISKIKEIFGTEIINMDSKELNAYYQKTGAKEAENWKNKWVEEAIKVVEPSEEEILKSARMYLALKKVMEEKKIDAVTIDCLGLYYGGKLFAYPCLSLFQLNNEGSTGVCEADLDSTVTQLTMRYLTGRPGYVSDPVIDTSSNQIIYAHCVATNKVYGPEDLANPYLIRSHSEDRKGASVQSLMPLGDVVTTIKINIMEKALSIHQGKTVANVEDDKACRTKLAAEVDAENILVNWNAKFNFGWHRVTFYGDFKKQVIDLAILLGLQVFDEDNSN